MITCTFENGSLASPGLRHITVSVIVYRDRQVLLGRRGTKNGKPISEFGKWGLLGGFFDRNETLVEAARREVMEESGWQVSTLTLFIINDNPDRPQEDRQNVDIIYLAQAEKQVSQPDEEVSELSWFELDRLPADAEIAFDHALALKLYRQHLDSPLQLPDWLS